MTEVRKEGGDVWHTVDGDVPSVGTAVEAEIDWERRHRLMRTQDVDWVSGDRWAVNPQGDEALSRRVAERTGGDLETVSC